MNDVTETVSIAPAEGLCRPPAKGTDAGRGTRLYDYHSASNVRKIGAQAFRYDVLNRLAFGETDNDEAQSAGYDSFNYITSKTTRGVFQSLPTSASTNRLALGGTVYDAAGNLTRLSMGGEVFEHEYDGVSMMRSLISNTDQAKVFLYDASDERVAVFECFSGTTVSACATEPPRLLWTIRDLDGKVLRSWERRLDGSGWTWLEDNIFRDGQPIATLLNNGSGEGTPRHLHLDHLGTPRQITNATGTQVAFHSYYPFGEEATDPNQDTVRLKFTGHERDPNGGSQGTLDYMHARYESPMIGRFLSVDPIGGNPRLAQSWNRYSYVLGNPANLVDPAGLISFPTIFQLTGFNRFVLDEVSVIAPARLLPLFNPTGFFEFLGAGHLLRNLDLLTGDALGFRGPVTSDIVRNTASAGNEIAMAAFGRQGVRPAINPIEFGVSFGVARLTATAVSVSAATARAPIARSGASISNLSKGEIVRIQNAANRIQREISVVGSRASGRAGPTSDFDFVITGIGNRLRHSVSSSLPVGPRLGIGAPRNQDIFTGPLLTSRPHITFFPR